MVAPRPVAPVVREFTAFERAVEEAGRKFYEQAKDGRGYQFVRDDGSKIGPPFIVSKPTPPICERSGNPSGTDTWSLGHPCPCKPCTTYCALLDDGVPFIVNASALPGTYREPLTYVGPVRSGSLREFEDEESGR